MALLTGNADPEFSSYSFNNLENLCEVQTKKGFFYKKAKLLHPGEDLCCLARLDDRSRFVIINVGGIKYKVPWTTLENCPLTRLGKLKSCNNYDEIMNICDDYDVSCNEFFFDRNPSAFRTIMTFLTAGKLRLLREMCALSFQEELVYWGIEEDHLEWCCKKRLRQKEEEAAEAQLFEREMVFSETAQCAFQDNSRLSLCMRKLRDMVENPHSGIPGKIFACISISFVAITAVSLCISTMPDVREEEDRTKAVARYVGISAPKGQLQQHQVHHFLCQLNIMGSFIGKIKIAGLEVLKSGDSGMSQDQRKSIEGECSQKCYDIFVLETVCVAWFSFEFLLRSIQAENKCAFLKTPLNIIDILAILPFYISLIVDMVSTKNSSKPGGGAGNKYLERVGLVLRFLRALRILYVMRLARHSLGLQTLGLTVRRCSREFGLLLLFLCVAMALFSPLVYLAESELGAKQEFTSVPTSYWWAVISMTTVGYGDMVPRSIPGQVVALSSILSGILLMAFPVTSIFHTFSRSYSELKEQQQRAASRQARQLQENTELPGGDSTRRLSATFPPSVSGQEGPPMVDQ
ncbi:Potassium voltage-gated channel subfamily G member 2 [Willisornis vidua]|uniref:Potassium voltage-gated channel subfamily G member 2 n=1 Tax=Willisornis vidua TaxID=1566151 RepID=A0ABQ9D517_9PASS|nr:Potassium voltage-gated channel subfamily G member 2 [Willisornis vidua]